MSVKEYKNDCDGCKISQGHKDVKGRIFVDLDGDWTLNHGRIYDLGEGVEVGKKESKRPLTQAKRK